MKVVIQRCSYGSVIVDSKLINEIKDGYVLLVGFTINDNEENIDKMIKKIINLRIFPDENDIMNKSILDVNGEILSISQFTLYANTNKGNRPSYIEALKHDEALKLYELFNNRLKEKINVKEGIFGANMKITIVNEGPTTIILEN